MYSYYFYKDSKKNYEVVVGVDKTFYKKDIHYYYIWNAGNNTIYKDDIINDTGCLTIYFKDNYVEYAEVTDITSNYFEVELYQNYSNIQIRVDLLRPDEGFTLLVKTKSSKSYWSLQIKQKKDVIHFPKFIKSRGLTSNMYMMLNIVHYCYLAFFSLFIAQRDLAKPNGWEDYLGLTLYLLIVGFVIYLTPTLFRRIRAPRPPKELKLHYLKKNNKILNLFVCNHDSQLLSIDFLFSCLFCKKNSFSC